MRIRSNRVQSGIRDSIWFYTPNPIDNPKMRLFCFPYAAGGAEIFYRWDEGLPQDVEVCALQLPGRSNRRNEKAITQLSVLIEILYHEITEFNDIPFAFFGHSMGALISFELSQLLFQNAHILPAYLFISAHRAPGIPPSHSPLHKMSNDEFIKVLQLYNIIPKEILQRDDVINYIMSIAKADFEMVETWKCNP